MVQSTFRLTPTKKRALLKAEEETTPAYRLVRYVNKRDRL